jgi:hypothetical protein
VDKSNIGAEEISYAADMLRAINCLQYERMEASNEAIAEIDAALSAAEVALRNVAAELSYEIVVPLESKSYHTYGLG